MTKYHKSVVWAFWGGGGRIGLFDCTVLVSAYGIQFPNQGSNPGPLDQELRVLASGPPRKSLTKGF